MFKTFLLILSSLVNNNPFYKTSDIDSNKQSPFPKILHCIWLGPLTDKKVTEVMQKKEYLPEYKIIFWCDQHEKWLQQTEHTITDKNITFRHYKDLLGYSANIDSVVSRELEGYANYAAASDVLRLVALYRHGGLYLDMDTTPGNNEITNKEARIENFGSELDKILSKHSGCEVLTPDYDQILSNNVIIAQPECPLLAELLTDISHEYSRYNNIDDDTFKFLWINKRFPIDHSTVERQNGTVELTGPSLLRLKQNSLDLKAAEQATIRVGRYQDIRGEFYGNKRICGFKRPSLFNGEASATWAKQYHTRKGPKSFKASREAWSTHSTPLTPY